MTSVYDSLLNKTVEEVFSSRWIGEMKQEIVAEIRKFQLVFLNPAFAPPKSHEKGQRGLNFQRINAE
jgi:hypothetical protein